MPIFIEKEKGGFKACDDKRCFSKRPMTKDQALKQRVAIALSLAKKEGKPTKAYFAWNYLEIFFILYIMKMHMNEHLAWIGAVLLLCMWIIWNTDEHGKGLRGELRWFFFCMHSIDG